MMSAAAPLTGRPDERLARCRERALGERLRRAPLLQGVDPSTVVLDPEALRQHNHGACAAGFHGLAPRIEAASQRLQSAAIGTRKAYHAHVLAALVEGFDPAASGMVLPDSILALVTAELERLLHHVESDDDYFDDLGHDSLRKDLALLAGRLLPVGAGLADPQSGIPRRTAFKAGVPQALAVGRLLLAAGGATPWLELHTHLDVLGEFNAAGWQRSYRRVGELLALNPRLRGVFRSSWFLDPALRSISPNLNYIADLPLAAGASLFFVAADLDGSSGALHRSERRREMFAQGRYRPCIHMMAWPRAALLRWAAGSPPG
jgi:hypothetical protein